MTCIRSYVQSVIWAGNVASSPESQGTGSGFSYSSLHIYKDVIFVSLQAGPFWVTTKLSVNVGTAGSALGSGTSGPRVVPHLRSW